jgi:hypothetical protein
MDISAYVFFDISAYGVIGQYVINASTVIGPPGPQGIPGLINEASAGYGLYWDASGYLDVSVATVGSCISSDASIVILRAKDASQDVSINNAFDYLEDLSTAITSHTPQDPSIQEIYDWGLWGILDHTAEGEQLLEIDYTAGFLNSISSARLVAGSGIDFDTSTDALGHLSYLTINSSVAVPVITGYVKESSLGPGFVWDGSSLLDVSILAMDYAYVDGSLNAKLNIDSSYGYVNNVLDNGFYQTLIERRENGPQGILVVMKVVANGGGIILTNASEGFFIGVNDASFALRSYVDGSISTLNASVNTALGAYATNASIGNAAFAKNASLGLYATNASVGLAIQNFSTNASVGTALGAYATNASIGTAAFAKNASFNAYATNVSTNAAFVIRDASIIRVDGSLNNITDITNLFLKNASIGAIGFYWNSSTLEVSTGFTSKGYVDGSLNVKQPLITFGTKDSSAIGTPGSWTYDASYLYICSSTNFWGRLLLTTGY